MMQDINFTSFALLIELNPSQVTVICSFELIPAADVF